MKKTLDLRFLPPYFWLSGMDNGFGHSCCLRSNDKNKYQMNIDKQLHFCISGYGIRIRITLFVVVIFLPMILLSEIAHTVSLSPYCYALACSILNPHYPYYRDSGRHNWLLINHLASISTPINPHRTINGRSHHSVTSINREMLIRYLSRIICIGSIKPDHILQVNGLPCLILPKKDNRKLSPLISIFKNFIMKGIG